MHQAFSSFRRDCEKRVILGRLWRQRGLRLQANAWTFKVFAERSPMVARSASCPVVAFYNYPGGITGHCLMPDNAQGLKLVGCMKPRFNPAIAHQVPQIDNVCVVLAHSDPCCSDPCCPQTGSVWGRSHRCNALSSLR